MGRLGAIRTLTSRRPILPLFHICCSWLFCFGLLLLGGAVGVASSTALVNTSASARAATVAASTLNSKQHLSTAVPLSVDRNHVLELHMYCPALTCRQEL
ncbi:hypothetical protein Taro_008877 [Colocasia esculenta]|uniref:Uncharacterized protein n=1 Tax=Colocasia esculenta TaxID=4460 RepID=A0A843TZF2_COLES|nr:hypothetical protein [Colocasia esculenta]